MATVQTTRLSATYRDRVMGCWLGKAVGGTLGMPNEGECGPFGLNYYDPPPTQMLPNDDLDLQVVWACVLREMEDVRVDREVLADAWLKHIGFACDEYGVAVRNLRQGIRPPYSGAFDNWYTCGMGAAIRSEIWACLAPGNPSLAAAYAIEDACVDHAGDGIWAEVFLAAMESAAFVESDIHRLIDAGLKHLPQNSQLFHAIEDTRRWYRRHHDWLVVRRLILEHYPHENFTDVTVNLCFIVLGILAGDGDFDRTICTAVNCGKDTDCTGATVAALMGIRNPSSIAERWLAPIGRSLQLSREIHDLDAPATLDELTDLVVELHQRLAMRPPMEQSGGDVRTGQKIQMEIAHAKGPWFGEGWPASWPMVVPVDARFETYPANGSICTMPRQQLVAPALIVRYPFHLTRARRVCMMFNSPHPCRVWVNGQYAFGRDGGRMAPSFHRVPVNQSARIDLPAGDHELIAAIMCPERGEINWVAGIGDDATNQWIEDAFLPAV